MVQMESSASYDDLMDESEPEGSDRLREGVQAAAKSLVESLNAGWKQIADAAESFAREKIQIIDTVAAKVERWAAEAREMASMAAQAASEAKDTSDQMQAARVAEQEQLQGQAQELIAAARVEISEVERWAAEAREVAGKAAQAASEAKEASEQMQAARVAEQEQLQAQAQELIAAARVEIGEAERASNEVLASAKQAAEEARGAALVAAAQATEAKNAGAQRSADPHTQELVDRLEADYRLLTELVQSLQARIAGFGEAQRESNSPYATGSDSMAPETEARGDPEASWTSTQPEPAPAPIPFPDRPAAQQSSLPRERWSDGAFQPAFVGTAALQQATDPASLSGRLIIKAAPIPDFEKLLGLDHALGRLPGVENVTLADYSKEEVTLRVDLAEPTSVEAFVSGLAQASGEELEVLAVGPGQLQLKVVRAE